PEGAVDFAGNALGLASLQDAVRIGDDSRGCASLAPGYLLACLRGAVPGPQRSTEVGQRRGFAQQNLQSGSSVGDDTGGYAEPVRAFRQEQPVCIANGCEEYPGDSPG